MLRKQVRNAQKKGCHIIGFGTEFTNMNTESFGM